MRAFPTGTVSILRGESVDEYGDPVDNNTIAASGVLASIHETTQDVYDQATSTPRTVRSIIARLPYGTDVRVSDRLRDDTTGIIYGVTNVFAPANTAFPADVRVDLERTT